MPYGTEQYEYSVSNLVRSKGVLAPNLDHLGMRSRIDRPRDLADPVDLVVRPFLGGAMPTDSFFGRG